MPEVRARGLGQFLRGLADEGRGGHAADRELLGRFVGGSDEAAFRALVCRHGPMVFRVCLRVLRREHDAEDAFQATFLVLARRAAAVRKSDSLASWLYGVADRVSRKMRAGAARRRTREGEVGRSDPGDPLAVLTVREAQDVLEQELAGLPERYRAPLVLCCLEGLTRDEAARRLGWEPGALKDRLERARERLRVRLSRRGLTIPAALLAGVLGPAPVTGAAVPTALVSSTVRAVAMVAAGRPAATVSAEAVAAAEGVIRAMTPGKITAATVLLVTAVLVGATVGAGGLAPPTADPPPGGAAPVPEGAARTDRDKLQGVWAMVSQDFYGVEKAPDEVVKKLNRRLTITGDLWTWAIPGGTVSGTVTLDPSKTPKALDITTKVDGKESRRRGIYRLEGDTLTYCLERGIAILEEDGTPRKLDRPAAFAVTEDSTELRVWKRSTPKPAAGPGAAAVKAVAPVLIPNEPVWKAGFRTAYGLRGDGVVRRVGPPYPGCRAEYFRDLLREVYKRSKLDPPPYELQNAMSDHFTVFAWKGGWPADQLMMQTTPVEPDEGVRLAQLLHMATGFRQTRTEGDAKLLEKKVTGDFVVRAGADPEKVAADIERILRKDCDLPVSLAVQEVEREVYVVSGKYEAKPLADRKKNQIEVYAAELTDRSTGGGGSGALQAMADHVEGFIERPVTLGDVEGAPKTVEWHFNHRSPVTAQHRAQDRDAEAVMKNITAQTGLEVKLEKRRIKVLVVKRAE